MWATVSLTTAKKRHRTRMIKRTITRTVTFAHPFTLSGIDETQPAGTYTVEADEELIQALSFPAYRSTGTWMRLPSRGRVASLTQAVSITPAELDEVFAKDAAMTSAAVTEPSPGHLPGDRVTLPYARGGGATTDTLRARLVRFLASLAPRFHR